MGIPIIDALSNLESGINSGLDASAAGDPNGANTIIQAIGNFFHAITSTGSTSPFQFSTPAWLTALQNTVQSVDPQTAFVCLIGVAAVITLVQKLFKVAITLVSIAVIILVLKHFGVL